MLTGNQFAKSQYVGKECNITVFKSKLFILQRITVLEPGGANIKAAGNFNIGDNNERSAWKILMI